jgi:hypothetical protein
VIPVFFRTRKTRVTGPKHKVEKVRWRRREIAPLHSFPSAAETSVPKSQMRPRRRRWKWLRRAGVTALLILGLGLGLTYLLLQQGVSSGFLSNRAQLALSDVVGPDYDTTFAQTRVSLDGERNLAIEASGVTIRDKATGRIAGSVGSVKLGIRALQLLQGKIEVARVEVIGSELDLTSAGAAASDPLEFLRGADGRLSAPKLVETVFKAVETAAGAASARRSQNLSFGGMTVKYGQPARPQKVEISALDVSQAGNGVIEVEGDVSWQGSPFRLAASITDKNRFQLSTGSIPLVLGEKRGGVEADGAPTQPRLATGVSVAMQGSSAGGAQVLRTNLILSDVAVNTGRNRMINGAGALALELRSDSDKAEILESSVRSGNSTFWFTGAVAPEIEREGAFYKFELVTTRARLLPLGSSDKAADLSAQTRGTFDASTNTVALTDIGVRTLTGELYGTGELMFKGTSPRALFALRIPRMSVAHAKLLWPVHVASGARSWVFDHVYGGTLADSTLDLDVPEGQFGAEPPRPLLTASQFQADFNVSGARFDVMGDLPPVRDAEGTVRVRGANTDISLKSGTAFLGNGQTAAVSNGTMKIPYERGKPVIADLKVDVAGQATALAAIAALDPVNAMRNAPFEISDLSGSAKARISATFPLRKDAAKAGTVWSAVIALDNVSVKKPFDGQTLSEANGTLTANPSLMKISADAKLNGLPAKLKLEQPLGDNGGKRKLSVQLELGEKTRAKLMPGLNQYVKGPVYVDLQGGSSAARQITADLTKASIILDFAGWSKGPGVGAAASFSMSQQDGRTVLEDFELSGGSFLMRGAASLDKSGLASANLSRVSLVRGDNVAAKITRTKGGYDVKLSGASLDVRAIVKKVTGSFDTAAKSIGSTGIAVSASIEKVTGFNSETMSNLQMTYAGRGSRVDALKISGATNNGGAVAISNRVEDGLRQVKIQSADAGSILRFFDYYDKMSGGSINIALATNGDGPMRGSIDARDFTLVNEPRMRSLVGGKPSDGGPSLKDAVKKDIDVSKVRFSRGSASIVKGENSLSLTEGILRGDLIGLSFKGTAYDPDGNMNMTGTFMPAYGLNRIFGEIPLLGQLLGNGEERGLIGITFRLSGKAKKPQLSVNPISLIAPGIFRQIFEFR